MWWQHKMGRSGLLWLLMAITSCGFEPVHQSKAGQLDIAEVLGVITVSTPAGREGDQLKAKLEDFLQPTGESNLPPRYRLETDLSVESLPFIIDPDGISSRFDLIMTSNYRFVRISDGSSLDSGKIRRVVSYNVSELNDYATYISLRDARQRGIDAIAQDMKKRIAALIARSMSDL